MLASCRDAIFTEPNENGNGNNPSGPAWFYLTGAGSSLILQGNIRLDDDRDKPQSNIRMIVCWEIPDSGRRSFYVYGQGTVGYGMPDGMGGSMYPLSITINRDTL